MKTALVLSLAAAALALPAAASANVSVDARYAVTGANQVTVSITNHGDPFYWAEVSSLDATHAEAPEPAKALSTCLAGSPSTWCSWPEDLETGATGVMRIDVNSLPTGPLKLVLARRTGDRATFAVSTTGATASGGGPKPAAATKTCGGTKVTMGITTTVGPARIAKAKPGPPSGALQGQCALPPTAACPATAGQLIRGSAGDESLTGTAGGDDINALAGNDEVDGGDGNDVLRGGPGRDVVRGGACDDVLFSSGDFDARWDGGRGDDVLNGAAAVMNGGPGADWIYNGFPRATTNGGAGDDHISVTMGSEEHVNGGPGNDVIDTRNHSRDVVDCGPGRDTLLRDPQDRARNC